MFGFFDTPFIDYCYRPVYYRPRYSVVDHYLLNFMRQLRAFDELELIDRQQYQSKEDQPEKQQEENDQKENAQKDSKEEVEVEVEGKQNEQDKKEDNIPKETKKKQNQNQNPFRNIYYYEGKSRYDGHNYVEEHRERLTDSEGKVHVTQRRRLGDRWYENESITDEEGKTLTKESWHNVPEDQIENFKLEWGKHHNKNYAQLTSNTQQEPSSDSTHDSTSNQKTDEKLNENQNTVENEQKTD